MEKQDLSMSEVAVMLHKLSRLFKKRTEENTQLDIKLTPEQFGLLFSLSRNESDIIQKELAEMMGKDKSSILRMIDPLEEMELIRRVVDSKDRRKNYLMVTKYGNRLIEQYQNMSEVMMSDIQQGLTQEEIDTFHKVVAHVKNKAELL